MSARRHRYDEIGRQDESLRRRTTFDENNRRIDPIFGPEVDTVISPASIPNLLAWYEARDLTLAEAATVTSWSDKSTNGRTLTPNAGTQTFQTFNGWPSVRMATGSSVGLVTAYDFAGNDHDGFTAFAVASVYPGGANPGPFITASDLGGSFHGGIFLANGRWAYDSNWWGSPLVMDERHLIVSTAFDDGNRTLQLYDGGVRVVNGSYSGGFAWSGLTHLALINQGLRIEAAAWYTRQLTQLERAEVTTYFASEFRIPLGAYAVGANSF